MTVRYLRAEELARFAGVAKSTVLAAIRRGEITSSRTVGRGTRISLDAARSYLESRGCPIPGELREARTSTIAVVTENVETVDAIRKAARSSWTVVGSTEAYATLLWVGAHVPALVVVDLGMSLLHPFEVIRALRTSPALGGSRVVAVGSNPDLLTAARVLGAADAVSLQDLEAVSRTLIRETPREQFAENSA